MRHAAAIALLAAVLPALVGLAPAAGEPEVVTDGPVTATIGPDRIRLSNGEVERVWSREPFGTVTMTDLRTGLTTGPSPDLRLALQGVELTGRDLVVDDATAEVRDGGGVVLTIELSAAGVGRVTRTITAYPGVAGFRTGTTLRLAGALTGYTLDEVTLPGAAATAHHFNAGYDWRGSDTPDWEPALSPFGGAHTGDHRETTSAGPGDPLEARAQWLSLRDADGRRAFLVTERVNYDSTRVAYDGTAGRSVVDLRHDVTYLGPFESDVHVSNPTDGAAGRARWLRPDRPLDLEPVFTGFGTDGDDEPWTFHEHLRHRSPDWDRAITFNSNGVDSNRISTGAKDDMDLAEVERQAAVARRLGVETFILDDGWQARSGDWCPDSPECPEPRDRWGPRFPDSEFRAVRDVLGDMELGLWMTPMHFHPSSHAYREHPEWACTPIGDGLAVYNTVEPESSSNEAGIGTWNPEAVGTDGRRLVEHVEQRVTRAIEVYGASYFKFDFLVWLDCLGDVEPVDAYRYRESFVAMVDRLQAAHPDVTFQIDETNDYRLFPFESVTRGPTWYANGSPTVDEALHNLWVLAPFVPPYTIGQAFMGDQRDLARFTTDYVAAAGLASHITFFDDLTGYTDAQVDTAAAWLDLYRRERDRLATFTYPLLDDPLGGDTWTALQPWDPETGRGSLLVFRQDHPDATRSVALRGVRGGGAYRLTDAVTGAELGVFAAARLRRGIDITLRDRHSARVLLIEPVDGRPDAPPSGSALVP